MIMRRGVGQVDVSNLPTTGTSPSDIAMGLTPLPANNPLSSTGQSILPAPVLDLASQLNAQYFASPVYAGPSLSTSAFGTWFANNSTYVVIGSAIVLAFLFFGGSSRRRR